MQNDKKIYLMRPDVGNEELEVIREVFESKFLTEGEFTKKFEVEFAKYVQTKHAVSTTSCTTALELALRTLGIGTGDEVIVPSFTFPATGNVVFAVGATPVLVDVDLDTYNTDADKIAKAISNKTKAVIPVSLFGNPLDMKPIKELQEKHHFAIIEDAACTIGAEVSGKKVGSQADITCFSFHPRKLLTTGEGGALVTNDDEIAEKARMLKNFGFIYEDDKRFALYSGLNYKLSNIQAAVGLVQLCKLERMIATRIKLAKYYFDLLVKVNNVRAPQTRSGTRHTFQSYCIYIHRKEGARDKLRKYLEQNNIETQIGTWALHMQPAYKHVRHTNPINSELGYKNVLTLPLHHELTEEDQKRIVELIDRFISKN